MPRIAIEDRLVNERIGLRERRLVSAGTHRFSGEPARSINAAERPKHQRKKPHDDERQVQRRRLEGRRIRLRLIDRKRTLEMQLRVQVIAAEPAGYPGCPVCDDRGHGDSGRCLATPVMASTNSRIGAISPWVRQALNRPNGSAPVRPDH